MSGNSHEEIDTEPDQNLWKAVVLQALLDASGQSKKTFGAWPDSKHESLKREALRWLLVDEEDFFDVCEMAGIDARLLRQFSKRLQDNDTDAQLLVIAFRNSFLRRGKREIGDEDDDE